jgi:hypothetical protein
MGQEFAPRVGMRVELSLIKDDILSHGVREGAHCLRRLCRAPVRVHAHTTEVVMKTRLHEGARSSIERLAG